MMTQIVTFNFYTLHLFERLTATCIIIFTRSISGSKAGASPGHGRGPALGGWLVLACLAVSTPALSASPPLLLGAEDSAPLAGHMEVLEDRSGRLTLDEVMAKGAEFRSLPGDFGVGYTSAAWWLRVRIVPETGADGPWYLAINAPYTDQIETFAPDVTADGHVAPTHKRTGGLLPLATRDLITNTYTVRVTLTAGEPTEVYLRLSGTRAVNAKPVLWRLPAFLKHQTLHVLLTAIAMGAAMITAIGSVIFGIWLRNRQFVWYGVYVGATALVFVSNSGFLALILDMLEPRTVLRIQGVVSCLSIMTGAFMVRSIFCPPGRMRLLGQAILAFGALAGVAIPISAAGYYGMIAPLLMSGVLILAAIVPIIAALQLRGGGPAAAWYFVGFSSYAIATFWFAVMVFGLVPPTALMDWGHQSIGLLHMVAIFAGLSAALRVGARERQSLQSSLLRASQRNAAELEQAVAERTAALEAEIIARQDAEAALQVALREQRNFLVMVSHEFRTPLANVRAAIAVIERELDTAADHLRREAGKIVRAVVRLNSLIETFLTDELVQTASMRMEVVPVDLAALAGTLAREFATESGREVSIAGVAQAEVEGDPVLLRSVVENLIGNAIKHSDGEVRVTLDATPDGYTLRVRDEGGGIAPEEQKAIFDRYYRSPAARSRPGAGLGLHIAKRVVEMHQGGIRVLSAPGAGSTFEIWLPRVQHTSLSLVPTPGD